MTNPTLWNQFLIWPIVNVLIALYKLFTVLGVAGAFGFAIIGLTMLLRGIMLPLTHKQLESARAMQHLKPRLDELAKKHKDDKLKLQQAQLELYQQAGVNPVGGCLPLLIQLPVFIALYNVFIQLLNNGNGQDAVEAINAILYHPFLQISQLDLTFLGLNLATKPSEWQSAGVWLLLVPIITGGLQFVQSKMMLPSVSKPKTDKAEGETDQMQAMQQQMSLLMPAMIGFFAFSFPIGLSLYWNTNTLFGIIQQQQINKKQRS